MRKIEKVVKTIVRLDSYSLQGYCLFKKDGFPVQADNYSNYVFKIKHTTVNNDNDFEVCKTLKWYTYHTKKCKKQALLMHALKVIYWLCPKFSKHRGK